MFTVSSSRGEIQNIGPIGRDIRRLRRTNALRPRVGVGLMSDFECEEFSSIMRRRYMRLWKMNGGLNRQGMRRSGGCWRLILPPTHLSGWQLKGTGGQQPD